MARGRKPSRLAVLNPNPTDDGVLTVDDVVLDVEESLLRKALRDRLARRPRLPQALRNWLVDAVTDALDRSEVGEWSGLVRFRPDHGTHTWRKVPGKRIICFGCIPSPRWDRDRVEALMMRSWAHGEPTYLDYVVKLLTSHPKRGALARAATAVVAGLLQQPPRSMLHRLEGFRDTRAARRFRSVTKRVSLPRRTKPNPTP